MGNTSDFLDRANNPTTTLVTAKGNDTNELQAILSPSAEICLLRDSPFRILRVSEEQYNSTLRISIIPYPINSCKISVNKS